MRTAPARSRLSPSFYLDGLPARFSVIRPLLLALVVLSLAACGAPEPIVPPEGWQGTDTRWWAPGTDTSVAFRDLSSLEAMGIEPASDDFAAWVQEQLLPIYRSHPEIVDSVFTAGVVPTLAPPADGFTFQSEASALANDVKRDFYQRYNHTQKIPGEGISVPDSLQNVSGEVVLQVYVNRDTQPVAVQLLEGTGTALDQIAMRDAATGSYTEAWVRPTAGQSAGVKIPSWVRITQRFGGE